MVRVRIHFLWTVCEWLTTTFSKDNKRYTMPSSSRRRPRPGDVVTVDWNLRPEGTFVPEPLFDQTGRIQFVAGWGNYLPGLHELVYQHDAVEGISLDAGWGARRDDMIVTVPKTQVAFDNLHVGQWLQLRADVSVEVVALDETTVTVDANPPLAGSSYECNMNVVKVESLPSHVLQAAGSQSAGDHVDEDSPYHVATFGLGCFWGAELAFMRVDGVVGTRVGYSQGRTANPTYEQVCEGSTRHREVVLVVYDSRQVSYEQLLAVAMERLDATAAPAISLLLQEPDDMDENWQYKYGFHFHSEDQQQAAEAMLAKENRYGVEVLKAATFYPAEENHQQYLYKGGQSTRKNAKERIRCFG